MVTSSQWGTDECRDESWSHLANLNAPLHNRKISDFSITFSHDTDTDIPLYLDDDVTLTMDPDSALGVTTEQEGADDDAVAAGNHEGNELHQESLGVAHAFSGGGIEEGRRVPQAQQTPSNHTSRTSTVNGDEIGYEDQNVADDSVETVESTQEQAAGEDDEIDWENDGAEDEEQKAVAPTPSSASGKRSRTNEVESVADETGMDFPATIDWTTAN